MFPFLILLVAAMPWTAFAQNAKVETPPDRKAFTAANAIKDPRKKIEALEKFKRDFPASDSLEAADRTIFSTLVKKTPDEHARIHDQARAMYRKAAARKKDGTAAAIAEELAGAGVVLKDAEWYARKAVKTMNEAHCLQERKEGYAKAKAKAPPEELLRKSCRESRAARIATLGQVYVKRGKAAAGQKLLEDAYAVIPMGAGVADTLGVLANKSGDERQAFEYLTVARLSGRASKNAVSAFEDLYRKRHSGSLDGAEAVLDAEYRRRYPNELNVERYRAGSKRSGRVALAEIFTGSGCPPCAGADLAFGAAMERYSRTELALLMYHQHIPRPDPMVNPDSQLRAKTYALSGVPTFAIDGKKVVGGGSRYMAPEIYQSFNPDIEKELEAPAEARIQLEATQTGEMVKVRAAVEGINSDARKLTLLVALVEQELRFSGENGVRFHPMVVRAITGFPVERTKADPVEHTFDLAAVRRAARKNLDDLETNGFRGEEYRFAEKKDAINANDLGVVAFVQDDESKHVLQAAWFDLRPKTPKQVTE